MSALAPRPTLRATPTAHRTIAARGAQARLEALRSRVETEPGSGQAAALSKAEQHVIHGRLEQADETIRAVEILLNERREAALVSARLKETLALNSGRGEEQEGQGTGEVRVLSRDGMLWLKHKKRLLGSSLLAAEQYRKTWTVVHSGEVRTSQHGGSRVNGPASVEPSALRVEAMRDITAAHRDGLLRDEALIRLVEAVCGRGDTILDLAKGDKHEAKRLEAELNVACRLLAKHYGIG